MVCPLRLGRGILAGAAFAGYLWLAHITTAPGQPSTLGALVAVVPYMGIALAMAWKSRNRGAALALWAAVAVGLWQSWTVVEARFEWVYFVQHAGVFSLLALGFGRSLAGDSEATITRFARMVHGDAMHPALARYTRGATLAWTLFFAAMATVSTGLFFFGPPHVWSLLINLLTPPLIALMFASEFLARVLLLPSSVRTGLVDSVRACIASRRASGGATPPPAA